MDGVQTSVALTVGKTNAGAEKLAWLGVLVAYTGWGCFCSHYGCYCCHSASSDGAYGS